MHRGRVGPYGMLSGAGAAIMSGSG